MRLVLALLVAGATVPLAAQSRSAADSALIAADTARGVHPDSMAPLLDHTFNGPGEFVRFFMSGGSVYRAVLDRDDVSLTVEGVLLETPPVTIVALQRFHDLGHGREYLFRAAVDGEYQLRAPFAAALDTSANGSTIGVQSGSTRLRLYQDKKETRRWNATGDVAWAFGLEISGGPGQAYEAGPSGPVSGSVGAIEGCLTARYGPGLGADLGGCIIGVRHESPHGRAGATFVFIEPRYRLIGSGRRWAQALDVGVLLRAGLGQIDRVNRQPGVVAPGIYLNFTILHHPHLPRLVLEAAARYAYIFSAGPGTQNSAQGTFGLGIF